MKRKINIKILLLLFISIKSLNCQPSLYVNYPNGGEIIEEGQPTTISWESSTFQCNIDIFLWNGSSKTFTPIIWVKLIFWGEGLYLYKNDGRKWKRK